MITISRALASIVVTVAALWALERWCVRPQRCNVEVASLDAATEQLFRLRGDYGASVQARSRIDRLRRCEVTPGLAVAAHTLAAANAIIAEQPHAALREYGEALRWDRRPEIYAQLAAVQFEMGDHDAAVRSAARALWANPYAERDLPFGLGTIWEFAHQYVDAHPKPPPGELMTP